MAFVPAGSRVSWRGGAGGLKAWDAGAAPGQTLPPGWRVGVLRRVRGHLCALVSPCIKGHSSSIPALVLLYHILKITSFV